MNLEKIRGAAERVARSEGLEVADVEWLVGKQRILRVFIDRLPDASGNGAEHDPYAKISHADCERVSQQLSVILDVEELLPGPPAVRISRVVAALSTSRTIVVASSNDGNTENSSGLCT